MSINDVFTTSGVSKSQISKIENGKTDPRMSTVTQILSCYGASLSDLEAAPSGAVSLEQVKQQAYGAAEKLLRAGLGASDADERLARKATRQIDTVAEREALATRV